MAPRIKVLYIAGSGRCGSTILSNTIGQLPGFFSAGELFFIWNTRLRQRYLCGCGQKVIDCEVWKAIFEEGFGSFGNVDVEALAHTRDKSIHTRSLILNRKSFQDDDLKQYANFTKKLYHAIQHVTGCNVIIDSSKVPAYSWFLRRLSSLEVYVTHLVRDPRAVINSWSKKKRLPTAEGTAYLKQTSLLQGALTWNLMNMTIETMWKKQSGKYLLIRYEDFVEQPYAVIQQMFGLVDEPYSDRLPLSQHTVNLKATHTIGGNPSRFTTGEVNLVVDNDWKTRLKTTDRCVVTACTWPLMLKYGYPKRSH